MKNYYVTTPIYYVNDKPHIGHSYTTIAADILARYYRLLGHKVFFLTGTDEHGQKIDEAAAANGMDPKSFVDKLAPSFKKAWEKLNITYDGFIRTTDRQHVKAVQELINILYKKGDIYLSEYEGLYCSACEQFYLEKDLIEKEKCPVHGTKAKHIKEPSYFFRLSEFQDKLLQFYDTNPDFISPSFRKDEIINRVKEGLKDLSISRKNLKWGIPFPFDDEHVVYVWFDALCNYITALGWSGKEDSKNENFKNFWPANVHLIGKEINWFHSVIWPAMLMSAGIEIPEKVFAHGWWTVEGEKMSKTRGNVIDPIQLSEEYGVDVVRYFLMREVSFGLDGDFSIEKLKQRYNTDLANDIGNLLNRSLNMCHKYFNAVVPESNTSYSELDKQLLDLVSDLPKKIEIHLQNLAFNLALESIWEIINKANKYIELSAPWVLAKEGKKEELARIIYILLESQRVCAGYLSPFMPQTAEKILNQLNCDFSVKLSPGVVVNKPEPIFPRLEI